MKKRISVVMLALLILNVVMMIINTFWLGEVYDYQYVILHIEIFLLFLFACIERKKKNEILAKKKALFLIIMLLSIIILFLLFRFISLLQ